MLNMNDLKLNSVIQHEQEPYTITSAQHVQMGRGSAVLRTKIKNLITGSVLEKTFKNGDRIEEASLNKSKANFLYAENDQFYFMDNESFEQFSFDKESLEDKTKWLKDGQTVDILNFNKKPVVINLPKKIELKVTEAPPGVRGDTAQGSATKKVTLETSAIINAPLFINENDIIRINTETGEYTERA